MKKILIIFLLFIFVLTGCNKKIDTTEVKEKIFEIVNEYDQNIELNDIKVIGKYDDSYIISIYKPMLFEENVNNKTINGIEIKCSNYYEILCFKENNLYTIEFSADKGWLIEEDLLEIKKQLQMCDYKPNEDIKSYKSVKRCDHSCIIDNIVASTCTTKGLKTIKCDNCNKNLKNIELDYIAHNYVNSICSNCGEKEYTLISRNEELENESNPQLLGYKIIDWFGSYSYNDKEIHVYYLSKYSANSKVGLYYEIVGDLMFSFISDTKVKVFCDNNQYDLQEAYENNIINKNLCLEIFNQYLEENICNLELYNRYDELKSKDYDKDYYLNYVQNMNELHQNRLVYMKTYYLDFPFAEDTKLSSKYLGNYDNARIIYFEKNRNHLCYYNIDSQIYKINEYQFECHNSDLVIIYEDKVYNIVEAFEKSILSLDHIEKIYEKFSFHFK